MFFFEICYNKSIHNFNQNCSMIEKTLKIHFRFNKATIYFDLNLKKLISPKLLNFIIFIFQNSNFQILMNLIEIDRLSRETHHKSLTINKLLNQIDCLKNNIKTQNEIIAKIESQKQQLKKQIQTIKRKLQDQQYQKQNTQSRFLLVLKKLQEEVEQGKKKFNKLNNKISPLIEYDSVRLSVMADIGSQHELELEKYKHTIEVQKDEIQKLKRQKALLQHKIETLTIQYEQKIRMLNNSVKNQSSQNQLTALSLQMSKEIENRLKMSYDTARKEAEYYKDKYFTSQKKHQEKFNSLEQELKNLRSDVQ